jgi:hypothetical protein
MTNRYIAIIAALFAILSVSVYGQGVNAQASSQTLSNSTVNAILNNFNPAIQTIPTTSYAPPSGCPMPSASNSSGSINKIKCGLYASDPLNNETETQQQLQASSGYWRYEGDAPLLNASYAFYRDSEGLHISTESPANGTWAGYFAVTPNTNAELFHAVISNPVNTIPYGYYENGLYVQTSQPFVNYVACVSITSSLGTIWTVGHTYGDSDQQLTVQTLWTDNSANQSLTRDCTMITNGQNYLKVYLDGNMVYSSDTLALGMPSPFNAYLEPETSYTGQMLTGTYNDFYATTAENVQIQNIPSNAATAELVDSSGNVLASAPVLLSNATINVGQFDLPQQANIEILDSNNNTLDSTPVIESVYGGDVYSVVGSTSSTPSVNASQVTGAILSESNQTTIPSVPSVNGSQVTGTINDTAISTIGLIPSAPSTSAPAAHLAVSSQAVNGTVITGYRVLLEHSGIVIGRGYTPKTFTLVDNQQYIVHPEDYGAYTFDHWSDTGSTVRDRSISISSNTAITAVYRTS